MQIETLAEFYDYAVARVPVWNGLARASIVACREWEMPSPTNIMSCAKGGTSGPVIRVNVDQTADCSDEYMLHSLGHEIGHIYKWQPGDGHDAVWEAGMRSAGLEPDIWWDDDGKRQSSETVIPGGPFDIAMTEFLAGARAREAAPVSQPRRGAPEAPHVRRHGPGVAPGERHLIAVDLSGSMAEDLDDDTRRDTAQYKAVVQICSQLGERCSVIAHAGNVVPVHSSELEFLERGAYPSSAFPSLEGSTCFIAPFRAATNSDCTHFHFFSDGGHIAGRGGRVREIFRIRDARKYKITTYCIIGGNYEDSIEAADNIDLMRRLARDGAAHVIRNSEDFIRHLGQSTGVTPMANDVVPASGRYVDLAAELKATLAPMSGHANLVREIVSVGSRVNGLEDRVARGEHRQALTQFAQELAGQIASQGAQALGYLREQSEASQRLHDQHAAELRNALHVTGEATLQASKAGIAGALRAGAERAATAPDRSAPVSFSSSPHVRLDDVIADVDALFSGRGAASPYGIAGPSEAPMEPVYPREGVRAGSGR